METEPVRSYDAFICHASEDKDSFVRGLAQALTDAGLHVWYDEFSLRLGDSLRQSIEKGISQSKFGVVVLSPNFFDKAWPQAELNGLFAKEMTQGKTIIPIWHNIGYAQIAAISPIIADKCAVKTSQGLGTVIEKVLDAIDPGNYHRTKNNRTISIVPRTFRLQSGKWSVKTPVRVSNHGPDILYAVSIVFRITGPDYAAGDIGIDIPSTGSTVRSSPGRPPVSCDSLVMGCVDSEGKEALFVVVTRLPSGESRDIIFTGLKSLPDGQESYCEVRTVDFSTEPVEYLMESDGQVAIKFSPPENLTVKSIGFRTA